MTRALRTPAALLALCALSFADCKSQGAPTPEPQPSAKAATSAAAPVEKGPGAPSAAPSGAAQAAPALTGLPKDMNVILLSIDSLRADMPWAGYPRPIAPRLTALEAKSVSYTRAYAVSSYTAMSLGGLLAGRYPSSLGRDGFFFGNYAKDSPFFPKLLQKSGVRTLGAQAHGYFKSAGFENGFDAWELVPNLKWNNTTDENVSGPQHEAIAERLLSDPKLDTQRFFAWFHFLDPHDQYMAHDADGIPPFGKGLRDKYDAEVLFTDQQVGKLLDFMAQKSWFSRTVIVITSDHGEAFGEHNQFSHGFELWENLVRVPLMFVIPGVPPRRIDTPRSAVDIAPTVLELMQTAQDPGFVGKSLVPEFLGQPAEPRDVICDLPMTSDNDRRRALIAGRKKLLSVSTDNYLRLYDLDADPTEDKPILKGPELDDLAVRYRNISKTIVEKVPTACGPNCLNRAYAKDKK
jgi:choline-sulfatase